MPELPEVETVRRDLSRLVCGSVVAGVKLLREEMLVGGTPRGLKRALQGATITEIGRQGKALILRFSSGYSLIVHFRMTGQLYPVGPDEKLPQHTRTVLRLEDGRRLVHVDVRALGTLELVKTESESKAASLANIGPDAWTAPPGIEELCAALARRECAIKVFLLDQKPMSGIGNIYACEILHRARIAPDAPSNQIARSEVRRLLAAMKRVLAEAIESRGTTISDYLTGTGEAGGYQDRLRVYGREGEKCMRRGCSGEIARTVQGQRSTYYCPVCQGLVRGSE